MLIGQTADNMSRGLRRTCATEYADDSTMQMRAMLDSSVPYEHAFADTAVSTLAKIFLYSFAVAAESALIEMSHSQPSASFEIFATASPIACKRARSSQQRAPTYRSLY